MYTNFYCCPEDRHDAESYFAIDFFGEGGQVWDNLLFLVDTSNTSYQVYLHVVLQS